MDGSMIAIDGSSSDGQQRRDGRWNGKAIAMGNLTATATMAAMTQTVTMMPNSGKHNEDQAIMMTTGITEWGGCRQSCQGTLSSRDAVIAPMAVLL
jgi:hypothetical protein